MSTPHQVVPSFLRDFYSIFTVKFIINKKRLNNKEKKEGRADYVITGYNTHHYNGGLSTAYLRRQNMSDGIFHYLQPCNLEHLSKGKECNDVLVAINRFFTSLTVRKDMSVTCEPPSICKQVSAIKDLKNLTSSTRS